MDKKKTALIIGGIAALGIAAYFFLGQKTEDDFGPAGGASGQASGYEGGGPGVTYQFGGDTIQFPGGGDTGLNDILKALMGGGTPEGESKKEATVSGAPQIVGVFQKPADYLTVGMANKERYGIPDKFLSGGASQDGQAGIMTGLTASMGGVLDILFRPATVGVALGTTVKKTITGGGPSGGGVLGTSRGGYTGSSGFVAPAPVAILGQSGGSPGVPGSSQAAQYVQGKYGQPGSGYVVRGYSLTGVPLYKPAG